MAQITEDYVSFETARLLKKKGFDEPCYAYWHEDENRLIISQSMYAIQNITNPCFFGPAAPTLQMAMKWLNESHNLYIFARPYVNEDGVSYLYEIKRLHKHKLMIEPVATETCFEKSEQACEAAIKYCLENLI